MSWLAERWSSRAASILVAATAMAWTGSAGAFEVKKTPSGNLVHWTTSDVGFEVDPTLTRHMRGAFEAFGAAIAAWSGASGAPALYANMSVTAGKIQVDGVNTVALAPEDFEPIGAALAVTVVSFEDATGDIVDADIVVSRDYAFAVLPASAKPPDGATAVSNEASEGGSRRRSEEVSFDLQHVLAHEVGHSLGMGDTRSDIEALMYAYSMPGNPLPRAPTTDDSAGIAELYPPGVLNSGVGCGESNVAGARPGGGDCASAFALLAMLGAWRASRRKAQLCIPAGLALAMTFAEPATAHLALSNHGVRAQATSRVVSRASRTAAAGVFETTLELEPVRCHIARCPRHVRAHVWGGTVGGITQQVGGYAAPAGGEVVDVAFTGTMLEVDVAEATIVHTRAGL